MLRGLRRSTRFSVLEEELLFTLSPKPFSAAEEVIRFGKTVRKPAEPRVSPGRDPWQVQLQMAREEWRRRHPRAIA
jgi:hypothetical protein